MLFGMFKRAHFTITQETQSEFPNCRQKISTCTLAVITKRTVYFVHCAFCIPMVYDLYRYVYNALNATKNLYHEFLSDTSF